MTEYAEKFAQEARLVILATLAQERDGSLNSLNLTRSIDSMGRPRPREWVDTQLLFLEELGAVELKTVNLPGLGEVRVAKLTTLGRNHVEGRITIAGVAYSAEA